MEIPSKKLFLLLSMGLLLFTQCAPKQTPLYKVSAPNSENTLFFLVDNLGRPTYFVEHNGDRVIDSSRLSMAFEGLPLLGENLEVVSADSFSFEESWEMPWGAKRTVENRYNALRLQLKERAEKGREFSLVFKIYDDGLGFRYEFPEMEGQDSLIILHENTEFALIGDPECWWQPGDWDIYEHLYNHTKFSEIDALECANHVNLAQTFIPYNAVNTPVTLKTEKGVYLSFHEANLTDYAGMTLKIEEDPNRFVSELVGSDRLGYKAKCKLPFNTPWRTIQIVDRAADLIESDLIVNLNEPNVLGDVSWFKPTKYVGIWWDMHLSTKSWDYASGNHGATTAYAKDLIDFAAKNGIHGILIEGWNTGWEYWVGFEDREGVFDFVTSYPDYDLEEVVRYGKEHGVELIMHHETSAAVRTYDQQMDTAYSLMESLGIHSVKTGYVGKIIPKGEYHHGQWMVNNYRKAVVEGAKHKIAINAHEPIKATGIRRTYPNAISREGLRGQEFNAWSVDGGNPPNHIANVVFTRMLAGPIDFTPGIFNIKLDPYKADNQVNTTLSQQLALYVVLNSPIQMVPDLMEAYEGHPAFQFIRDVAVNWEQSVVLDGEPGEFVAIAREARDSGNWFLGAITNEAPRSLNVTCEFLEVGVTYEATLYCDAKDAHWDKNPEAYTIQKRSVVKGDELTLNLASGGGAAVSFIKQ